MPHRALCADPLQCLLLTSSFDGFYVGNYTINKCSNRAGDGLRDRAGSQSVRIVSVTTHVVNAEMRNWVFVRVDTDQSGLYGWGEATLEWKTRAVAGAVEDIAPLVIGRAP